MKTFCEFFFFFFLFSRKIHTMFLFCMINIYIYFLIQLTPDATPPLAALSHSHQLVSVFLILTSTDFATRRLKSVQFNVDVRMPANTRRETISSCSFLCVMQANFSKTRLPSSHNARVDNVTFGSMFFTSELRQLFRSTEQHQLLQVCLHSPLF